MTATAPRAPRLGPRRGFTLIEIAVSVVLLAAAMMLTVQVLGWVASGRRASERRQWAAQEAANVMERFTALPWERISPESARAVTLSPEARQGLPHEELAVSVDDQDGGRSKRVSVRIRWRNRAGEWDAPVRLTAWVYRHGRAAP
jgi:prepilin-type N-terminal cleavage/methylation domain-containing protein